MRRTRTTTLASALFALTIVLAACSNDSGSSSAPADGGGGTGGGGETVSMASTKFTPSSLTIQAGTTVTFTDTSGHTVTEGTDAQAVQTETRTCVGQNFSRPGTVPAQVIGIGEHPVSGQLDPRNPGSRLTGSETFYDESTGATTTVTWDLMHVGGPIRLPRI